MDRLPMADRLSSIAGALAAVAAAAGLFVTGLYRDAPFWAQQAQGTDVATLFLAVPILLVGLWAARAGSQVGRLSAIAGILYLIYNYAIFAFAVEVNPLLAVYIGILSLAVWSLTLTLVADLTPRTLLPSLPRRTTAGVLIGVAVVFALLWLSQIAGATLTGEIPVDLERAELPTNPVWTLDLAFFLPLCVIAGIGLLRRAPAVGTFALPMLIWLFLTSAGIVAAFVFATMAGDPFPMVPGVLVSSIGILTGGLAAFGVLRAGATDSTAGRLT
jgi:hypothetical protein